MSSSGFFRRPIKPTFQPDLRNCNAVALPIPDPAPVVALDFPGLVNGQQVEGIVEVLTDLNTSDFVRVWFETSVDGGAFDGYDFNSRTAKRAFGNNSVFADSQLRIRTR